MQGLPIFRHQATVKQATPPRVQPGTGSDLNTRANRSEITVESIQRAGRLLSGVYDPAVASSGDLTIDTPAGPVDLVAVDRARRGLRTSLTPADRAYLLSTLSSQAWAETEIAAAGMGVTPASVRRAMTRRNAKVRLGVAA